MYFKLQSYIKLGLVVLVFSAFNSHADMVVIVNAANDSKINTASVKKIFLGKTKTFLNGSKAVPIEVESGAIRAEFSAKVLRKPVASLESYWSRMLFTGKASPPKTYSSEADIVDLVEKNPSLIGYVDRANVTAGVKIIAITKR